MAISSMGGIYGLSGSGLDIDSIVEKLMTSQQTKLDSLNQKITSAEWQKTAYNKIYDSISDFRTSLFDYKLSSKLSPNSATSSNTSVATVTANSGAASINHSLIVAQLAAGVSMTSSATITTGTSKSTLSEQFGVTNNFALTISNGTSSSTINVAADDSIYEVVSAINSAGVNVSATYDSNEDRFFLSTTNTGASAGISITTASTNASGTDDGGNFIKALKLFSADPTTTSTNDGTNTTTTTTFTSASGKDAVFQLDGTALTKSSNSFTIAGVSYKLLAVSNGTLPTDVQYSIFSGSAISVSVTKDITTAVSNIKSLVESYNKVLDQLNDVLSESRYRNYLPLTDAQKKEMKESEITDWTAKAKSGMLRHDSTLTNLVSTMRSDMSSIVSGITGTYKSVSSIGITTGDYSEGGKLYLDENKLTEVLQANPNVLTDLFSGENGITNKLYDGIKESMNKVAKLAGTTATASSDNNSSLAKRIDQYENQLDTEKDRFDTIREAYYTKFNAMEVALQSLNTQSSWMTSMYSSTTNSTSS